MTFLFNAGNALQLVVDVLLTSVSELFHLTADRLGQLTETFFSKLSTGLPASVAPSNSGLSYFRR